MSFPFAFPVQVNPIAIAAVGVAIGVLVFLPLLLRRRGKISPDMYALVIDETDGSISMMQFIKIADRVYAAINTSYPLFLIIPTNTRVYQCITATKTKVPCVISYARGLLALPLDPKVTSTLSHMLSTDELEHLENEEVVKLLRTLYDMEEKKFGKIRLGGPAVVAMAFDVKRLVSEIINKVFGAASEAVIHYFRSARNIEALERYLQALAAYSARRYAWLIYLAIIIIVIAIAAVLVLQFFGGHR